jgi:hypothetical protein
MNSCSLSYLGGVFDLAAMILCGSDAVMDPVTVWIITWTVRDANASLDGTVGAPLVAATFSPGAVMTQTPPMAAPLAHPS